MIAFHQLEIFDQDIWEAIPNFEMYECSIDGKVRRRVDGGSPIAKAGRLLKPSVGRYLRYALCVQGKMSWETAHRLVLLTFVGPPPTERHQGAHIDGNRYNNRLSNLRWALPKENSADRIRHGTQVSGSDHPNTRLSKIQIRAIRQLGEMGFSHKLISDAVGVGESSIGRIIRNETYRR